MTRFNDMRDLINVSDDVKAANPELFGKPTSAKKPQPKQPSSLEVKFAQILDLSGFAGEYDTEYRFHPERRWKFDFALVNRRIAFEVEGGTYSGGRHVRGKGYAGDCEKYNTASMMGWTVFRFTTDHFRDGHIYYVLKGIKGDNDE